MSDTFDIYKYTNGNGSSKIWAIRYDPDGVTISYGKTDKVNRTTKVPLAKCAGSPENEAEKRAKKKVAEGYVFQGEGTIKTGRVTIQNTANKPQNLYWEFDGGGMSDDEFASILEECKQAIRTIARHSGWGVNIRDNGFHYNHQHHSFAFFFEDEPKNGGMMSYRDKRGQGIIRADQRTFLGLFFLRLAALYGSRLTIANESGAELDLSNRLWPLPELFGPVPEEWVTLAAEELELKPVAIKFEELKDTSLGEWFY